MHPKWEPLYDQLLAELAQCRDGDKPEADQAECGYRIAVEYWLLAKQKFMARVMQVDDEEIEFFREIKPRFTAYIEYYLILNQAVLFVPEEQLNETSYWQEEQTRYKRFYERNKDFIAYYESGSIDKNYHYFLERNNYTDAPSHERIYEDGDCRSSHDHLVRGLLANQLYSAYVQERLNHLSNVTLPPPDH